MDNWPSIMQEQWFFRSRAGGTGRSFRSGPGNLDFFLGAALPCPYLLPGKLVSQPHLRWEVESSQIGELGNMNGDRICWSGRSREGIGRRERSPERMKMAIISVVGIRKFFSEHSQASQIFLSWTSKNS